MTLRANIDRLRLAISDQNLELIPDYEQRIGVLQELNFIDSNSVVLLKGRVACEVRFDRLLSLSCSPHYRSQTLSHLHHWLLTSN